MKKNSYLTVTDLFCGAGGSSIGAVAAGAELKVALNHWKLAIETHNSNFPEALHDCTDISSCDPRRYPSTDILIASPECVNHSLAKGKKRKGLGQLSLWDTTPLDPSEERSRATMWDVPRFVEYHDYNLIIVENVVDARYWRLFDAWLQVMDQLGYDHEIVYYNSQHAWPTPQSRDRMYCVFWKKHNPAPHLRFTPPAYCVHCQRDVSSVQSWKNPQRRWGKYRVQYVYRCPVCASQVEPYYYCAANAIDWSLPAPRIGDREQLGKKPLKEQTLDRIRVGLERFKDQALLVGLYGPAGQKRPIGTIENPYPTQTASRTWAMVIPPFLKEQKTITPRIESSLHSTSAQTSGGMMPFLVSLNHSTHRVREISAAMATVMPYARPALVIPPEGNGLYDQSRLVGTNLSQQQRSGAISSHPFLVSYYTRLRGNRAAIAAIDDPIPTVPGWAVHYLAQPGEVPDVEDCGFRMLQPHEIHRAMAFPEGYQVRGNQRDRIKQYGNAITPPVMQMLLERCIATF